ncbi:MAG: hypothetical protein KGL58_05775, partial [Pseudomonadota bacterium]|nr:hypothetical protein [Pseudomonadota bacterium]
MNLIHLKIVFGTLDLLGSYMVMGLFASRLWLLSEDSVVLIPLIQRFGRFYLWSLTTLILGSISHFIVNALILGGKAGLWQTFSLMGQILMESHFGHAWLIHFIALAVLILGYGFCRKRLPEKDVSGFFLLINALLLLSITAIGRSGNFGNFTVIELIDWTHLVATAILGGSFITLTYLLPAGLVGLEVGKRDEL